MVIDTGETLCKLTTGTDEILNHNNLRRKYLRFARCLPFFQNLSYCHIRLWKNLLSYCHIRLWTRFPQLRVDLGRSLSEAFFHVLQMEFILVSEFRRPSRSPLAHTHTHTHTQRVASTTENVTQCRRARQVSAVLQRYRHRKRPHYYRKRPH